MKRIIINTIYGTIIGLMVGAIIGWIVFALVDNSGHGLFIVIGYTVVTGVSSFFFWAFICPLIDRIVR